MGEMDTDSAYMGLTDDFQHVIKPHLRSHFWKNYSQWFPRMACDNHSDLFIQTMCNGDDWDMQTCCKKINAYDQRTPGLFKEEFAGIGIVSLNSKTYYCWGENHEEDKYRSKGLSRRQNNLTKEQFIDVLQEKSKVCGVNRGFRKISNNMFTYAQQKSGLSYFYAKRKVLADGISTIPLDI